MYQSRSFFFYGGLEQTLWSRTIGIFLSSVFTQRAEQVTLFCRQQVEYSDDDEPKPSVHLSQAQKLRKVIIELVDTERSYVKVSKNILATFSLRWAFCVVDCWNGRGCCSLYIENNWLTLQKWKSLLTWALLLSMALRSESKKLCFPAKANCQLTAVTCRRPRVQLPAKNCRDTANPRDRRVWTGDPDCEVNESN